MIASFMEVGKLVTLVQWGFAGGALALLILAGNVIVPVLRQKRELSPSRIRLCWGYMGLCIVTMICMLVAPWVQPPERIDREFAISRLKPVEQNLNGITGFQGLLDNVKKFIDGLPEDYRKNHPTEMDAVNQNLKRAIDFVSDSSTKIAVVMQSLQNKNSSNGLALP
jgi:hypothetical protein